MLLLDIFSKFDDLGLASKASVSSSSDELLIKLIVVFVFSGLFIVFTSIFDLIFLESTRAEIVL